MGKKNGSRHMSFLLTKAKTFKSCMVLELTDKVAYLMGDKGAKQVVVPPTKEGNEGMFEAAEDLEEVRPSVPSQMQDLPQQDPPSTQDLL